jgi:hypothetical protein
MLRLPARSFHGSWRSAPARELEKGSHFAAAMSWRRKIGTAVAAVDGPRRYWFCFCSTRRTRVPVAVLPGSMPFLRDVEGATRRASRSLLDRLVGVAPRFAIMAG